MWWCLSWDPCLHVSISGQGCHMLHFCVHHGTTPKDCQCHTCDELSVCQWASLKVFEIVRLTTFHICDMTASVVTFFISVMCMHQQCWWTAIAVLTNQIMFFYIYRYFEAGIILYLWFRVMILQGEKWPETFETFILRLHFVNLLIFVPYVKHGSDPTHCCDPFWKWCMSWWSKFGKHSCWFYMKISDQIRSQLLHIASQLSWFIDIQSTIWRTQPKYTKTINCRFKTWMELV